MASGAMSVSLMKPNLSSAFSTFSAAGAPLLMAPSSRASAAGNKYESLPRRRRVAPGTIENNLFITSSYGSWFQSQMKKASAGANLPPPAGRLCPLATPRGFPRRSLQPHNPPLGDEPMCRQRCAHTAGSELPPLQTPCHHYNMQKYKALFTPHSSTTWLGAPIQCTAAPQ